MEDTKIDNVVRDVGELLGMELDNETIRCHAFPGVRWAEYQGPTLDRLARAIWDDVTDGAEWPWD